jgi:hypothetical protein
MTARIEAAAGQAGARAIGRIRYDSAVTRAQLAARVVVEIGGPAAEDIGTIWTLLMEKETYGSIG